MDFRSEAEKYLQQLKKLGYDRSRIELELNYSDNYIDQQLSKGGNKRFVASLRALHDRILQKARIDEFPESVVNEDQEEIISMRSLLDQQNKLISSLNRQSETANEILRKMSHGVEQKIDKMDINLSDALGRVDSLKLDLYSGRVVILRSLARLEKKSEDELLAEADNIISVLMGEQKRVQGKSYKKNRKHN